MKKISSYCYTSLLFCFITINTLIGQTDLGYSGDLNYNGYRHYGAQFRIFDDTPEHGANRNTIWIGSVSTTRFDLGAGDRGAIAMSILTNSHIGIGTTTPTRLLDVNGALRVRSGGKNNDPMIDLDNSGSGNRRWSRINSEGQLALAANDQLSGDNSNPHLIINENGIVQITGGNDVITLPTSAKHALYVQKGITSSDYSIGPKNTWADYVFLEDYPIMPLKELKTFIETKRHLPNMPTQEEIAEKGYDLHAVNVKLLEKVEELTLYMLNQQEQIEALQKVILKQQ